MKSDLYLILHGHFYQPPRQNPWLRSIETQPGAGPHHDWNERILFECYRPNTLSRRMDRDGRIREIVNNLEKISFNFGPTLLEYIERADREVYRRIVDADRLSADEHGGHGNAIAQAYHHVILPLAPREDRELLIRWGLDDFTRRFGREAEGLWLPETAIHDGTALDLARAGLRFVILSPFQAEKFRDLDGGEWSDVTDGSIDPRRPYRLFPDREDRELSIDVFFYDGVLSSGISFEHYLRNAEKLGDRLVAAGGAEDFPNRLVIAATDGEVYGHHEPFADMCLAALFGGAAADRGLKVTNPAEFLDLAPPVHEVVLKPGPDGEGTAWSCSHGVGRWVRDCGCSISNRSDWNQKWRTPLRDALNGLRDDLRSLYREEGASLFRDPDGAFLRYVRVLGGKRREEWDSFLREEGNDGVAGDQAASEKAYHLLEMAHGTVRMFTSCGWFFDDIAGIEPSQDLLFAAHALDLARSFDEGRVGKAEERFRRRLRPARSNVPAEGDGQSIFDDRVKGARLTLADWVAFIAAASLLDVEVPGRLLGDREYEKIGEERIQTDHFRAHRGEIRVREPFLPGADSFRFVAALGTEPRLLVWVGDETLDTGAVDRVGSLEELRGSLPDDAYTLTDLQREARRLLVDRLVEEEKETFFEVEESYFGWLGALAVMLGRAGLPGPPWFRRSLSLLVERQILSAVGDLIESVESGGEREKHLERLKHAEALAERFSVEWERHEGERRLREFALGMLRQGREGDREGAAAAVLDLLQSLTGAGFPILDLGQLQDEFYDQLKEKAPPGPVGKELGVWLDFSPEILSPPELRA